MQQGTMADSQVIVVEDDENVAHLIMRALRKEGFGVEGAGSLTEARERLSRPWDLVLLDRRLPDGDGIELCTELRAQNPHSYILILTGENTKEAKLAGFGCGADDYVTKPFAIEELMARVRAGVRIVELQKQLLTTNRQLEELSRTDALTQLANRRWFEQEVATRFAHAQRYRRPMSLAMLDVDHFKRINDAHGHPAGDEVLRCVGEILRRLTRQSDFAARYGGEEFVILLPELQLLEALQFAEKIRSAVAAEHFRSGLPQRVTVSIGLASMPHSSFASAAEMVASADEALYRAKAHGRNQVECEKRKVPAREVTSAVFR
jgi:diguanylate cyclase (GGDEF)-like protein